VFVNWKPYRLSRDNSLAIFSLFGLFLLLYAGLIMKCRSGETGAQLSGDKNLGIWLVVMTMFFPVGGLLMVVRDIVMPEKVSGLQVR
jgi:hypothetical protein